MQFKSSNYFVLNEYSDFWETKPTFNEEGIIDIPFTTDFRYKKTSVIKLDRLYPRNISEYIFELDNCNVLYILQTNLKLLYDTNLSTLETIENKLNDLKNLIGMSIGNKQLYIVQEDGISVASKEVKPFSWKLVYNSQHVKFILVDEYEKYLFFYDNVAKSINRIGLSIGNQVSELFSFYEIRKYTNEEILGLGINNRFNAIYLLFSDTILVVDYIEGKVKAKFDFKIIKNHEIKPSSFVIDNMTGDIYVGVTDTKKFLSYIIKIKYLENNEEFCNLIDFKFVNYMGKSDKLLFLNKNSTCDHILSFHFDYNHTSREQNKDNNNRNIYIEFLQRIKRYDKNKSFIFYTKFLDSIKLDLVWHRIHIDVTTHPNTSFRVEYFCSNNQKINLLNEDWISGPVNLNDFLIPDCVGRYMKLRIIINSSDGYHIPEIRRIKIWFEQSTYLEYLPTVYQEETEINEFLKRFLFVFQTLYDESYDKIFSVTKYLDPDSTPNEFLGWLSSWLSLSFYNNWSNDAIREFINRSSEIYKKRGTKQAIEDIILIYLNNIEPKKTTMQKYQTVVNSNKLTSLSNINSVDQNLNSNNFDIYQSKLFIMENNYDPSIISANDVDFIQKNPYTFIVFLSPLIEDKHIPTIERIIETEKPAHTIGLINKVSPGFYLNQNSYLGLNSILSDDDDQPFMVGSSLGNNTKIEEN